MQTHISTFNHFVEELVYYKMRIIQMARGEVIKQEQLQIERCNFKAEDE